MKGGCHGPRQMGTANPTLKGVENQMRHLLYLAALLTALCTAGCVAEDEGRGGVGDHGDWDHGEYHQDHWDNREHRGDYGGYPGYDHDYDRR